MYVSTSELIHPRFAGLAEAACEPAAYALQRLARSIDMFNREAGKTYSDGKRLKLLGELVVSDADVLKSQLPDFIARGCCDAELLNLEAQVRALPWKFQKTHGAKVVRVEVFRDIAAAHRNLLAAIAQARLKTANHAACSPSGSKP